MAEETKEATYDSVSDYARRLSAINSTLQFTTIKGKEYAQVNQRILAFWGLFPNGRIATKKLFDNEKRCDFEAAVYRDQADEKPAATGHAFEVKAGNINSTSYVENCETSAIGRALGFLGIGATTAIASAEEVLHAIEQQGGSTVEDVDLSWIGEQSKRLAAMGYSEAETAGYLADVWRQGGRQLAEGAAADMARKVEASQQAEA